MGDHKGADAEEAVAVGAAADGRDRDKEKMEREEEEEADRSAGKPFSGSSRAVRRAGRARKLAQGMLVPKLAHEGHDLVRGILSGVQCGRASCNACRSPACSL
jgi:hypothetical protein